MILITGGCGFIGSNLINQINSKFVAIEDLKNLNFKKKYIKNKNKIIKFFFWKDIDFRKLNKYKFTACIHLGAISSTQETNIRKLKLSNVTFSKKIFKYCEKKKIDFIYASSAAVYGNGKRGFIDSLNIKKQYLYKPLNAYGKSKLSFDKFVLKNFKQSKLNKIIGLRLFNVYGINEFHKKKQSSPIFKFYSEIKSNKKLILYNDLKTNKKIERDFIYIDDVVKIIKNLIKIKKIKTILNIGTSKPRTFTDVAKIISKSFKGSKIIIKEIPPKIRMGYQFYTCSNNSILKKNKLINKFTTLEVGIKKYLKKLSINEQ